MVAKCTMVSSINFSYKPLPEKWLFHSLGLGGNNHMVLSVLSDMVGTYHLHLQKKRNTYDEVKQVKTLSVGLL